MRQDRSIRNQVSNSLQAGLLRVWIGLVLCAGLAITGCSMFKVNPEEPKTNILKEVFAKPKNQKGPGGTSQKQVGNEKVRLAGGLSLGDTDNLAFTPATLSDVLSELIDAEKWTSIRSLVGLYPDVVTRILMGEGNGLTPSNMEMIAKLLDEQWSGNGQDRWQDFVQSTKQSDGTEFLAKRNQFLKLLESNEIDDAFDLELSRSLTSGASVIAQAEALRLEGIAYLMLGKHRQSVERLDQSIRLLDKSHPYQASQIGLLLGEAHRHAGAMDDWKSSWEAAIETQSRLLSERGLSDPSFWSKAAFLRPVSTPWPSAAIRRLEHSLRDENLSLGSDQTSADEAVVWAIVGTQSLKRHESQNAILAFKKSEAMVSDMALKEELQMQQALAMIDGGQQGPASAILLKLGSKSNLLGDRSKAILATLKLQNGSLAQGMNLLQSSIKSSNQWPTSERLRAQADYGLAYLMLGREEQGIALLNQVHREFIKEKNFDQAAQCLDNIATYYEKTDQPAKHRTARANMKQLEVY